MLKPFLHPHSGTPSTAHYKQEKTSTPERRDIRTQLPKNQKLSPTFNRYLLIPLNSTNTSEKYINLCRSLHHNTPLSPLSRGENITLKPLIAKQKTASKLPSGEEKTLPKTVRFKVKLPPKRYNLFISKRFYPRKGIIAIFLLYLHPKKYKIT